MAILARVPREHLMLQLPLDGETSGPVIVFKLSMYEEPSVVFIADCSAKICHGTGVLARIRTQDALTASPRPNLATHPRLARKLASLHLND